MPKVAVAKPRPAAAPLITASARTGAGPRNQPRVQAAMMPNAAAPPNTLAGWPALASIGTAAAAFQALPKIGPYQGPPITNTSSVETPTAIQFMAASPRK